MSVNTDYIFYKTLNEPYLILEYLSLQINEFFILSSKKNINLYFAS